MSEYILSISYGKDSLACLGAIEKLSLPLDRIIHAEVWATPNIPADVPIMIDFKNKADNIIKQRWGIEVEHLKANRSYEEYFYSYYEKGKNAGRIYGFPMQIGPWCNNRLKTQVLEKIARETKDAIQYIGIAEDEPKRLEKLDGVTHISPLHLLGWTEANAKQWCIENDLLSPIYTSTHLRDGCWFCHNQGTQQLRELRKEYPELWQILLKWDNDSPIPFKSNGRTVRDYEERFSLEDEGFLDKEDYFKWEYLKNMPAKQICMFE